MARDPTAGPASGPEPPFPININGRIVRGFGRGSKELGIPTANLPIDGLAVGGNEDLTNGVYYGWAGICLDGAVGAEDAAGPMKPGESEAPASMTNAASASHKDYEIYPVVLSIGYNPFYKNKVRSVEVHVMHKFESDFYNSMMNLSILAYIRPELDYVNVEKLIEDINTDIEVARRSLEREAYQKRKEDAYLKDFSWERGQKL